jgi:hypothetical protein
VLILWKSLEVTLVLILSLEVTLVLILWKTSFVGKPCVACGVYTLGVFAWAISCVGFVLC